MAPDLQAISSRFCILGDFLSAAPYGDGHINDTYVAVYSQSGTRVRYIHQRINQSVFRDPVALMANVQRVTAHQHEWLAAAQATDRSRRALTLLPAADGLPYYLDEQGHCWRTYTFIEGARTYEVAESVDQAYVAAQAFGDFQRMVSDLAGPRLVETIPDFHHTPRRYAALDRALAADTLQRAAGAAAEIEFALSRRREAGSLVAAQAAGIIPERITHNDTKLNNILLDDASGAAVCVIDLDTVMPGLAPYDFGDMVRAYTSPAAEDERDLAKVTMRMAVFTALARGYLSSAGDFLLATERRSLAVAGWVITLENGVRFLTDYLQGDTYYKIHRPGQNLDRCRTQFKLVQSMEAQMAAMEAVVEAA